MWYTNKANGAKFYLLYDSIRNVHTGEKMVLIDNKAGERLLINQEVFLKNFEPILKTQEQHD